MISPELITRTVCQFLNIDVKDVFRNNHISGARKAEFVQARQLSIYFCRKYNNDTLAKIGEYFGRDHATIMNSIQVVKNDNQTNPIRKELFINIQNTLNNFVNQDDKELIRQEMLYFDYPGCEISSEALSYQIPK